MTEALVERGDGGSMFRRALALAVVSALIFVPVGPVNAASPQSAATANSAIAWLKTQQQADGGFEVAGFPGFETPDAVLALAEAAQSSNTWDSAAAHAAVLAVVKSGNSPLHYLDDLAD